MPCAAATCCDIDPRSLFKSPNRTSPTTAAPNRPQRKQARSPPADKVKELRAAVRQVVAPKLSNQLRQAAAVQMVQRLHM